MTDTNTLFREYLATCHSDEAEFLGLDEQYPDNADIKSRFYAHRAALLQATESKAESSTPLAFCMVVQSQYDGSMSIVRHFDSLDQGKQYRALMQQIFKEDRAIRDAEYNPYDDGGIGSDY